MRISLGRGLSNLAILLISTLLSVVCCELALRALYPHGALGAGADLDWFRDPASEVASTMMPDGQIGFRPKLNTEMYDANGILHKHRNALAAIHRRQTILFIGDSVTARGRIVNALRRLWDDPEIEILNGGVESFNLSQEVNFFLRFQSKHPVERIIHQVHGNDLQATPIVFRDESGALNVYALHAPERLVNEWLFRNSYLYRVGLAVFVSRRGEATTLSEAIENFTKIAAFAASRGIQYDVVLFPVLRPSNELLPGERRDWGLLEKACREALPRCISLLPVLDQMLSEGRPVQETTGDMWHPNDEFANEAAKYIHQSLE